MRKLAVCCLTVLLLLSTAGADRAYNPGEITGRLLKDYLPEGTLLGSVFTFALETSEPLSLGISSESAEALSRLLSNLEIYFALGKTVDGPRFEWAARYTGESGKEAELDFSLTANREGFFFESSLIDGKRINGRWDTLLLKAGLTETEVSALLPTDEPMLSRESLYSTAENLLPLFAPYVSSFLKWRSSLSEVTQTDIPAEGIFPAAAQETEIQVSEAEVADLLSAWAELLEQDEKLPAVWTEIGLAAFLDWPGTELTAFLRDIAESFRKDPEPSKLLFTTAVDENAMLLYWIAEEKLIDADDYNGVAIILEHDTERDIRLIRFTVGSRKGGETKTPLDLNLSLHRDAEDPRVFALTLDGAFESENAQYSFDAEYNQTALADDRGPYGYELSANEGVLFWKNGISQEGAEQTTLQFYLTGGGGEEADIVSRFVVMEGDDILHQGEYEAELYINPDSSGLSAGFDFFLSSSTLGITGLSISGDARPVPINPIAASLETVSIDDDETVLSSLFSEVAQGFFSLSSDFLSALPENDHTPLLKLISPDTGAESSDGSLDSDVTE